jgi:hypothetical protein
MNDEQLTVARSSGEGSQPVSGEGPSGAEVAIRLLSDGRCSVTAQGQGFRSNATYRPAGDPHRVKCAMPPIAPGRVVSLMVVLPAGAGRPSSSKPSLEWTRTQDRWTGKATLREWPDAVTLESPASMGPSVLWLACVLVGLAVFIASVRRRRGPARETAPGQEPGRTRLA